MSELALTPDTRRLVDTDTLAAAAHAAGFAALGMVSGRCEANARATLDRNDLRCHELLGLQVSDADAVVTMAERLAADAATVGASWVLVTFQVDPTGDVTRALKRAAAMFAKAGAGFAVEFSPLGPVATIQDGLAVLAALGTERSGLVIDSWNFCLGGSTWADLEQVPLDAIAYVQFADALAPFGEPDMEEAMTRRALPGDGVLELERFASTLRGRGWDGTVSMQVLSDSLRQLPVEEYARQVYDSAARFWR